MYSVRHVQITEWIRSFIWHIAPNPTSVFTLLLTRYASLCHDLCQLRQSIYAIHKPNPNPNPTLNRNPNANPNPNPNSDPNLNPNPNLNSNPSP